MKINGETMDKMSIKSYAVKHKLSIFNVMKMVKSGKLDTQIEESNGKEITYILMNEAKEKEVREGIVPLYEKDNMTLKEEFRLLKDEVTKLRDEIEILKKKLH